jgi:hypothetical protein
LLARLPPLLVICWVWCWGVGGGGGVGALPYFSKLRVVLFLLSWSFQYPCLIPHADLLAKLCLCQLAYFHETLCVSYALGGHLIAIHFNFVLSLITTWLTSQDCASGRIWNKMIVMWKFYFLLGILAKLRSATSASSCVSICLYRTTKLPLDRFSWNWNF